VNKNNFGISEVFVKTQMCFAPFCFEVFELFYIKKNYMENIFSKIISGVLCDM